MIISHTNIVFYLNIALQKISVNLPTSTSTASSSSPSSTLIPVNIIKQSTSFPPNFIHSLDSTHMLLIALNCSQYNLTSFAAVHDSFYSHAADYQKLNELIKKQFINLYSTPILQNLREELIQRYKGYKIPVVVKSINPTSTSSLPLSLPSKGRKYNKKNMIKKIIWRDLNIPPLPNEILLNTKSDISDNDNSSYRNASYRNRNERFNITQVLESQYFFN